MAKRKGTTGNTYRDAVRRSAIATALGGVTLGGSAAGIYNRARGARPAYLNRGTGYTTGGRSAGFLAGGALGARLGGARGAALGSALGMFAGGAAGAYGAIRSTRGAGGARGAAPVGRAGGSRALAG